MMSNIFDKLFQVQGIPIEALKFVPTGKNFAYLSILIRKKVRIVHDKWKEQMQTKLFTFDKDEFYLIFPKWSFALLKSVIERKINSLISVQTETRMRDGIEEFMYSEAKLLYKVSLDRFLKAIEDGHIFIDFDVRTGHNHGTKFRISQDS